MGTRLKKAQRKRQRPALTSRSNGDVNGLERLEAARLSLMRRLCRKRITKQEVALAHASEAISVDDELRLVRIVLMRCLVAHKNRPHDDVEFAVEAQLNGPDCIAGTDPKATSGRAWNRQRGSD
jgi:hypothetical protein